MIGAVFKLPIWASELWRFAGTDDYRPQLRVVRLERVDKERVAAVATNGHILVHATWWDDGLAARLEAKPIHLDAESLRLLRGLSVDRDVAVELVGSGVRRAGLLVPEATRDAAFPEWRTVIPAPHKRPTAHFRIDLRYLDSLRQYTEALGSGAYCLTAVVPPGPERVVRFDILSSDSVIGAALMPMRVEAPRP